MTRLGSTSEAARELHINVDAFQKRLQRRRLPFRPVGDLNGRLMWDLDEIKQAVARGEA